MFKINSNKTETERNKIQIYSIPFNLESLR